MDVRIAIAGDGQTLRRADALESLTGWLRGEPDLAGRVRMASSPPRPGEMGAITDAVVVAAGSGGTLSVLAASLKSWLSHPRRSDIRVVVRGEGDATIEIDAKRVKAEDVETLLRRLGGGTGPE